MPKCAREPWMPVPATPCPVRRQYHCIAFQLLYRLGGKGFLAKTGEGPPAIGFPHWQNSMALSG